MSHQSEYEKTISQAHKALYLMVDHRSSATPRNFELWYNYASGDDRNLIAKIDRALDENGNLPQALADRIYDENLSSAPASTQVTQISNDMSEEIAQIMSVLGQVQGQTTDYGKSLGSVSDELNGVSSDTDLKDIVSRLVASTQAMQEQTDAMEKQLQASQNHITELNQSLEAARYESRTDQLTGIANRKAFDETLKRLTAEAIDEETELCLLLGDIDHFKKFNDTYGHQTGDQVLRLVASCMTSVIKGQDFVARYGGEEFVVLLPGTNLQSAVTVGNNIRKTVLSKKLVKKSTGEDLGNIAMSFGAARFRPGEGLDTFVHRADACLYAAKRAGRNQVKCETDPDIDLDINAA